ncbi:lymphocyte antigen 6E-like isoform X2 [Erpetoichthys calabaricus]|uniref:lymphocyte antigen 6E-like isoform X2 n=1 Tax=Erpetoichthys calabaricus TaxID=27687 RepID=UPI002234D28F|nr:lymphocyte antigen 6E-like isoform X2 [Erpetoichthys calabaricus]
MKTCLTLFLLACFVAYSEPLSCFSCSNADTNFNCDFNLPQSCAENQVCFTATYTLGGSYKINKGCVNQNECDAASVFGNIDIGVASTSVKCCDYLLCNINGSTTARLNLLLLGVSALVLLVVGNITK